MWEKSEGQCWARKLSLGTKRINFRDFTNGQAFISIYIQFGKENYYTILLSQFTKSLNVEFFKLKNMRKSFCFGCNLLM